MKLANHTEGFPYAFYMNGFISALKYAIQYEVKMFCPNTIMESLGLDKFTEDKTIAQQCSKSIFVSLKNTVPQRPPITSTLRITSIRNFSEAKMDARREKGICYTCDEKFTQGHQCAEKNPYLLDVAFPPALEICAAP